MVLAGKVGGFDKSPGQIFVAAFAIVLALLFVVGEAPQSSKRNNRFESITFKLLLITLKLKTVEKIGTDTFLLLTTRPNG